MHWSIRSCLTVVSRHCSVCSNEFCYRLPGFSHHICSAHSVRTLCVDCELLCCAVRDSKELNRTHGRVTVAVSIGRRWPRTKTPSTPSRMPETGMRHLSALDVIAEAADAVQPPLVKRVVAQIVDRWRCLSSESWPTLLCTRTYRTYYVQMNLATAYAHYIMKALLKRLCQQSKFLYFTTCRSQYEMPLLLS